jgi:Phosphoesterase family
MRAQKLITDVYSALRRNEALLVVFYEEHGGFYDHVAPPKADPPDEHVATIPCQRRPSGIQIRSAWPSCAGDAGFALASWTRKERSRAEREHAARTLAAILGRRIHRDELEHARSWMRKIARRNYGNR